MKKINNPTHLQSIEWKKNVTIQFKDGNLIVCNTLDAFFAEDTEEEADSIGLIVVKVLAGNFYKKDDFDTVLANTIEYVILDGEYDN